jgi:hypothetical protein
MRPHVSSWAAGLSAVFDNVREKLLLPAAAAAVRTGITLSAAPSPSPWSCPRTSGDLRRTSSCCGWRTNRPCWPSHWPPHWGVCSSVSQQRVYHKLLGCWNNSCWNICIVLQLCVGVCVQACCAMVFNPCRIAGRCDPAGAFTVAAMFSCSNLLIRDGPLDRLLTM